MQRRYDRPITIQRKTETQSASGATITTWATLEASRPAFMSPVRGDESFSNPLLVATELVEFEIRYSSNVADLTPKDRIIYPALSSDTVQPRLIHDILAVQEVGRRIGLKITARRRPDIPEVEDDAGDFSMDFSSADNSGYLALLEDI